MQCAGAGSEWHQVYTGSNTSQKVTDLAPGQGYNFRVAACNVVGCGPWGAAAAVVTLLQPPQPPLSISLDLDTSSADRSANHTSSIACLPPVMLQFLVLQK